MWVPASVIMYLPIGNEIPISFQIFFCFGILIIQRALSCVILLCGHCPRLSFLSLLFFAHFIIFGGKTLIQSRSCLMAGVMASASGQPSCFPLVIVVQVGFFFFFLIVECIVNNTNSPVFIYVLHIHSNPVYFHVCLGLYVCVHLQYMVMTNNKLAISAFQKGWVPGRLEA